MSVEQVRPHDLREGDRVLVGGEVWTIEVAPLPGRDGGRGHRMVAGCDAGRSLSWSMRESQWPCVQRVARAEQTAVA